MQQNFQYVAIGQEFRDPIGGEWWIKISEDEAQLLSDPGVIETFNRQDLTEQYFLTGQAMPNDIRTRKELLIQKLVSYDLEYFVQFIRTSDAAKIALATMMMEGFIGYNNWSESALYEECVRRSLLPDSQ